MKAGERFWVLHRSKWAEGVAFWFGGTWSTGRMIFGTGWCWAGERPRSPYTWKTEYTGKWPPGQGPRKHNNREAPSGNGLLLEGRRQNKPCGELFTIVCRSVLSLCEVPLCEILEVWGGGGGQFSKIHSLLLKEKNSSDLKYWLWL